MAVNVVVGQSSTTSTVSTSTSLTTSPTTTSAPATTTTETAQGTFPATPLASKRFTYPSGIPYKVDTDDNLVRGSQLGYNICNSTTEGTGSMCQTSFLNSLDDFCLWAPPDPNSTVGDVEGGMVAWCTKPGHGTRLIPTGALTGVQFTRAPAYVSIVGFIDQTKINLAAGDWGGEMDPHGADLRGNPLGGLLFTNAFGDSNTTFTQAIEWHNFIGADFFCLKACDPSDSNDKRYCEHIFDRIGCAYNVPNNAQNGTFESCLADNQDFPGIYTENGEVKTYTQPAESLGAISTMPYTAKVPSSSECVQVKSADVYAVGGSTTSGTGTTAATGSATGGSGVGASRTSGSSAPTGSSASGSENGARGLVLPGSMALVGVISAVLMM
ncbi:hypothetical protein BDQ17DRAFT_1248774 [Cyathus striatus]|nr:hypothetical protein BDQ17DRAFT_1248774 [Cyathus striatus]